MTAASDVLLDDRVAPVLARLGLVVDARARVRDPLAAASTGPEMASANPANGLPLGSVRTATRDDLDAILRHATAAAEQWRDVPAPKRGKAVRRYAELLREHKDALGTLVALEMGKIKAEGDGEVQEMIDIADFAVGQSRMLYGLTMHSERPEHRMYEQWHPLGVVGIITRVQFPGRGVGVERDARRGLRRRHRSGSRRRRRRCARVAVPHLANACSRPTACRRSSSCSSTAATSSAQTLVDDRRVPLVSFTGSIARGPRGRRARGATRLGRACSSSAATTRSSSTDDADLDLAVPRDRVRRRRHGRPALHDDPPPVRARVADRRRARAAPDALRTAGAHRRSAEPGTLMGPLIDRAAVDVYESAVDEARAAGGKVVLRRQDARPARATSSSRRSSRASRRMRDRADARRSRRSCT